MMQKRLRVHPGDVCLLSFLGMLGAWLALVVAYRVGAPVSRDLLLAATLVLIVVGASARTVLDRASRCDARDMPSSVLGPRFMLGTLYAFVAICAAFVMDGVVRGSVFSVSVGLIFGVIPMGILAWMVRRHVR